MWPLIETNYCIESTRNRFPLDFAFEPLLSKKHRRKKDKIKVSKPNELFIWVDYLRCLLSFSMFSQNSTFQYSFLRSFFGWCQQIWTKFKTIIWLRRTIFSIQSRISSIKFVVAQQRSYRILVKILLNCPHFSGPTVCTCVCVIVVIHFFLSAVADFFHSYEWLGLY